MKRLMLCALLALGCDGTVQMDGLRPDMAPPSDDMTVRPGDMTDPNDMGRSDMTRPPGEDMSADMSAPTGCGVQEMYAALEPTCANCHRAGKTPYFSSATAFYNLLVSDPTWVTPGDPDGSGLIAILEGRASGQYPQMPLGTRTYADLEAAGEVSATIAEVRAFVSNLEGCQAIIPEPAPRVQVQRKSAAQIHRTLKQHLGLVDEDIVRYESNVSEERYPIWSPDNTNRIVSGVNVNPFGTSAARRWHALGGESYLRNIRANRALSPTFGQTITQVSQAWCRIAVEKQANTALFRHVDPSSLGGATPAQVRDNVRYLMLRFWGHAATQDVVDALATEIYDIYAARVDPATAWVAVCATLIRDPMWLVY